MSPHTSAEAERAIELEQRAHELRVEMHRTPGLIVELRQGLEELDSGRSYTIAELDQELDWTE